MEVFILFYLLFTLGIVIWAISDLPRWSKDRKKRKDYWKKKTGGKRNDYRRF